jgi:hypothetical protein
MPTLDSTAEWFLRLNGFFTVLNFVVHPVEPNEGTEGKLVGETGQPELRRFLARPCPQSRPLQ